MTLRARKGPPPLNQAEGGVTAIMDVMNRILAVFLVATGLAVAVHLMVTPLYHDGSAEYRVWEVMNWFMAVGVVAMLVVSYLRKRSLGDRRAEGSGTLEYVRVSLVYYGAIVLTMLFFWGWFWTLNPGSETGDAVTSHVVYFPFVDALYAVLALSVGRRLWNEGGSS